jgi:hypothetical protein
MDSVQKDLFRVFSCQKLEFKGKQTTSNGKVKLELEVDITNVINKPAADSALNSMAMSILSIVKTNLKDRNKFNSYNIKFITTDSTGGSEFKGIVFTPEAH